jgi:hypothetical protein
MKKNYLDLSGIGAICLMILFVMLFIPTGNAAVFLVNSQQEFDVAQNNAVMNDSIIWESGTYSGIYLNITKNNLHISAATLGGTIFTGASRANISGDYITFRGFQFVGGNIGTSDVINITGSHLLINEINIRAYTSYKYLRIREASQYVEVTYCNFENRLNLDDQNILSILVDETNPGYHKIQHCSFKNFAGTGNDLGIEPIRIGLSTQADRISRSLVEYCYFTQCDGDGELISSKATQNVYRFNTFENNSKAELVLRHGSEAIVYGNFFLNGKGGVRVREGQNHYIYNNYFSGLDDRAIFLQNESSDPLDNINIAFNTIVDCSEIILGGDGSFKPTNVTLANNIFAAPDDELFEDATGTETWIGNIANGALGIPLPANGITVANPQLAANSEGFLGLSENSPAINEAQSGYATLPQFAGMEAIDTDVLLDLMGQNRPPLIGDKDLGCNEYPHNILIQPIATEENTGPSYNTSTVNSVGSNPQMVQDLLEVFPNPASSQITITLENDYAAEVKVDIIDLQGTILKTIHRASIPAGKQSIKQDIGELPAGIYTVRVYSESHSNGTRRIQTTALVKQ